MRAIDVLVVGAGPVGLALAVELEIAGAHAVVLERLPEIDTAPKARGVGVLGSEALRRRGLGASLQGSDHVLRKEFRREMGTDRGQFAWIAKLDTTVLGSDEHRIGALIWQPELERLLGERARELGADVRREHRVTSVVQDDIQVQVGVETPNGSREYVASYIVGCDGGRSSVRSMAGFEFPGVDATAVTRVARVRPTDPAAFPQRVRNARGTLQYRGIHDGRIRIRVSEPQDTVTDPRDRSPVTMTEMHDALERVTGVDVGLVEVDVGLVEIDEARRMRDSTRQAATYRQGRILLAGDAAHVHSPAGGQGLNLGIMDAVNLGWKLAAVVSGQANAELLDSYTRERHPVGAQVLANTLAQAALLEPTPQVEALRDIVGDLMEFPDVQAYFSKMMSGLAVRYQLPYATETEHDLLGTHVPDFVVDYTTLYALLSDGRPLLLHTPLAVDAAKAAASWADHVAIRPVLLLGRSDLTAALLRPDGVLAWAATNEQPDLTSLTTALGTWFGTQNTNSGR